MPIGFALDPSRRVVFLRAWGTLSDATLDELPETLRSTRGFDPAFAALVDLRPVSVFAIDARFISGHATQSAFRVGSRRAFVVESPESTGVARTYQLASGFDTDQMRIFRQVEPAMSWLRLPPESVWPAGFPQVVIGSE